VSKLTRDDLRKLVGDLPDVVLSSILATGASAAEVARAAAWLRAGEESEGPQAPLTGKAQRVLDILQEATPIDEEEDERRD
jgi:hypothetical protein